MLIQAALYAFLLIRLLVSRLFRAYPFFFTFVLFETLRTAAMSAIPARTNLYAETYFSTQPIAWMLQALTALEVFRVSLKSHPGIATLGRRTVTIAVMVATTAALLSMLAGAGAEHSPFLQLERFILFERVIVTSLLVFLMTLLAFLAYFPVPLSRNALWHAGLFNLYLLAKTVLWIVRTFTGPEFTQIMNLILNGVVLATLVTWILVLNAAGETKVVRSSRRANKEEEERLILQLNRLNRTLSRSARQ